MCVMKIDIYRNIWRSNEI